MPDLMTASGRAAMLKSLTPNVAKLERTLARQSKPILKTLGSLDTKTLARLGGGVAAFAAIFYAAQSLLKKSDGGNGSKAQPKRARARSGSSSGRSANTPARKARPASRTRKTSRAS